MSKFLKRTLTIALTLCMLLSVMAPIAVSAEDPIVTQTFTFGATTDSVATSDQTDSVNYKSYVRSYSTALTGRYPDLSSNNRDWWYYLGHSKSANLRNGYLSATHTTVGCGWVAAVIDVAEAGNYELTLDIRVDVNNAGTFDFRIFPYSTTLVETIQSNAGSSYSISSSNLGTPLMNVNVNCGYKGYYGTAHQAVLGNCDFPEAGTYIVYISGAKKVAGSYVGGAVSALSMTKGGTSGRSLSEALYNSRDYSASRAYKRVQICSDITHTGTELNLYPCSVLDLNGHKVTANALTYGTSQNDGTGQIIDSSEGNGSLVITGDSTPGLSATNGTGLANFNKLQFPIEAEENTYKFTTVQTVTGVALKEREGAEAGTKSFGFDVGLLTVAYGWDLSNVTVKVEAFVIGAENDGAECTYSAKNIEDWAADNAGSDTTAFYVDIANYDLIAEEDLTFRITVSSVGMSVVTEVAYNNAAAVA